MSLFEVEWAIVMSDVKRSLLDMSPGGKTDDEEEPSEDEPTESNETFAEFCSRQARNVVHFLVEDWCLSALLGVITAVLSVGMDVAIEILQHGNKRFFERCPEQLLRHWTGDGAVHIFTALATYYFVYFLLVAVCISINVPAGVFVPSFVIGAAGGRLVGELMVYFFPEGMRGPGGPPIHPGLYAVVGAAAYTGAVTHTLSVAVIICELTGQLAPILPVLKAISTVLQCYGIVPSEIIDESNVPGNVVSAALFHKLIGGVDDRWQKVLRKPACSTG
ncbi:chloride transporter, ClC family [Teladorsagia circumcincta]|uniref:Chloride transporter, ClC family n=2 Tax=Teladorsagia circumcincta TaxID=45464 RepID=A0A2G9UTD4_TELCI|nr:chloride transporter, ClC family [Teladorsagia circumcincta]